MDTLTTSQIVILVLALIWGIGWKGWALWRAARNEAKVWYIVLLLVNTLGILEILYIFIFSQKDHKSE